MMNGIQFQSVQTPNALSSELRSVIRDNVLQFYVQGNGMDVQEEGITALYERLSQEDKLDGESNSIANQKKILERYCKDHGYTAIRNVFNEMYARDTSKKIRATWQSKGKSGEHLTTIPPYGYIKDPEDKKKWIVDEEAAAVVQKIFSLCVDGL